MKTNLPPHINNWSFKGVKSSSFVEKYDLIIIIAIFAIAYMIIF